MKKHFAYMLNILATGLIVSLFLASVTCAHEPVTATKSFEELFESLPPALGDKPLLSPVFKPRNYQAYKRESREPFVLSTHHDGEKIHLNIGQESGAEEFVAIFNVPATKILVVRVHGHAWASVKSPWTTKENIYPCTLKPLPGSLDNEIKEKLSRGLIFNVPA